MGRTLQPGEERADRSAWPGFLITAALMLLAACGNPTPPTAEAERLLEPHVLAPMAALEPGGTERVSIASDGAQGDLSSGQPRVSADGRYVAFASWASNLVSSDTNRWFDVFVHDRDSGETVRVSVATDGTQGDAQSYEPSVSADGRFVAFYSSASNLVPGDTNRSADVFVHDRETGVTERVSVASDGAQGDRIGVGLVGGGTSISADGRYVAFASVFSNLVPGDTNGEIDIFVHDRVTGATERVSVASGGAQGDSGGAWPSISGDGRYVAFHSDATNLVPGDTNGRVHVFVHDRVTGATERVSDAGDGAPGDDSSFVPYITPDGRYVAFESRASNLVPGDTNGVSDVFVHDRVTGATERVSVASDGGQADSESDWPSISADGRYVAFDSIATNLVPGDTNQGGGFVPNYDVFIHDRVSGETTRASVASDGTQANSDSSGSNISADGGYVAFGSSASNLVPGDTNDQPDVFVHRRSSSAFPFEGFFEPVQMGALNLVSAGRVIPLRFRIAGGYGLQAIAGTPTVKRIACDTGEPVSDIDDGDTTSSGQSGFQYDPATDEYQYNWRTQRSWSNTCREFTLALTDGTTHSANFKFR